MNTFQKIIHYSLFIVSFAAFAAFAADHDPELAAIKEAQLDCKYPRISVHMGRAEVHVRADKAMKFYNERLADTNAEHRAQLTYLAELAIRAYLRAEDFDAVKDLSESLFTNKTSAIGSRIASAEYLAERARRIDNDIFKADKIYEEAVSWKDFGDAGKLPYYAKRAAFRGEHGGEEGELAYLNDVVMNWQPEQYRDSFIRPRTAKLFAAIYEKYKDYRGLYEFWLREGNKEEALNVIFNGYLSDEPAKEKLSREMVSQAAKGKMPLNAWVYLFQTDEKFAMKYYDNALGNTNALSAALLWSLTRADLRTVYGINSPTQYQNHELTVRTYELYSKLQDMLGAPVAFDAAQYATYGYAATKQLDKAIAAANKGLANTTLKTNEIYQLKVTAAILSLKGNRAQNLNTLKTVEPKLAEGVAPKDRVDRFGRAGVVAVLSEVSAIQEAVADYVREVVDPDPKQKSYEVRYSERPIGGIGDWVNMPFKPVEADLDRKFGGPGMEFMVTDVATGDRGNAVKGEEGRKSPVTLQVVADEWGIHFVYTFYDNRARQFESGELDPGSFESYIAPGENQPYTCFLSYPKKETEPFIMNTTYNTPGQKRVNLKDRFSLRSDAMFTDDTVVCYTAFSWDTFAEHVPVDGGEWDFETVFWGPTQCAWNGTKSIHGRSTWGKLKFKLGEKARTDIMRKQLYKAAQYYLEEKKPAGHLKMSRGAQGGVFYFWNDAEYGDPEFYKEILAPLQAELDEAAAKVKTTMTDAEVREITEKYFLRFRNIRNEVSRLRREWMRRILIKSL